jgi:hypothetical protein
VVSLLVFAHNSPDTIAVPPDAMRPRPAERTITPSLNGNHIADSHGSDAFG